MNSANKPNRNEGNNIQDLTHLAGKVDISSANVEKSSSSVMGRFILWLTSKQGKMPKWTAKHIEIHKQFEKAVNKIVAKGEGDQIPSDVIKTLETSKEVVRQIANKVNYSAFLKSILPDTATVDQHGLLTGKKDETIKQSHTEWQLNLGLLMNAHTRTKDPAVQKQIEFLALNYLAKAAPIDLQELGLEADSATFEKFEEMFQLGVFQEATYHRESAIYEPYISSELQETFPNLPSIMGNTFLTDTTEFQDLLPLFFTTMDTPNTGSNDSGAATTIESQVSGLVDGWSNNLTNALVNHFQNNPGDTFNNYIDPPIIADLTDLIGDDIQTNGDLEKEEVFKEKMEVIEGGFEKAIDHTIAKIKKEHQELCKTPEDEQKLRVFLKFNISCISRSEVKGVGVLKSLHIFMNPKHYVLPEGTNKFLKVKGDPTKLSYQICGDKAPRTNIDLLALVNYSGIRLGGVRGREKIFNFIDLKRFVDRSATKMQMTEYAVSGENVIAFKGKGEVAKSALFQRFKVRMGNEKFAKDNPETAILGKATADILEGLMNEISDEKWEELNYNPDTRMILQQSLFRAMQHLAKAENNTGNFTEFAQGIELIQSEIATILTLTSPFEDGDFQKIYQARLDIVPEQFKGNVRAGVTKSAMNTFAGINAAVQQMSPSLERAHGEGAYFEEISFLGTNRTTQKVLESEEYTPIDLYVGEFHHNIDINMSTDNYSTGAVKDEVRAILEKNKKTTKGGQGTQYLTVAVDVTIDFVNSPHAKELLEEFADEIEDGTLNVVFFRSGQKFDMLGMDNYYGGPFWMVNNGGEQWKGFEKLTTSETHKTDPLSMQWFCLANKYAPAALDDYRGQIFDNARSIIKGVPADLVTGGKLADQVRISTVDDDMKASCIDIKILHPKCATVVDKMKQRLAERFAENGVKMHQRSSFGFYHANWNVIPAYHDDKGLRNVRINPGLNPEENQIILDFIKEDIPTILAEMK